MQVEGQETTKPGREKLVVCLEQFVNKQEEEMVLETACLLIW